MKNILFLILISIVFSCKKDKEQNIIKESNEGHNKELIEIYENDQNERSTNDIDWYKLNINDSLRRIRVLQLLDSGKINTGKDYARAAIVFQHGSDSSDYGLAVKFMKTAIKKDTTINKWLLAAATDRYLLSKNEPQIYGTQYLKMGDGPWELDKIDTTKISDAERKKYGVRTLAEQRLYVKEMNSESN